MRTLTVALVTTASTVAAVSGQAAPSWLDRPLSAWQRPGDPIPAPSGASEPRETLARRCGAPGATLATTAAVALTKAGWVPFLHLDRQIARDDVEIVGGMSSAGPDCGAMQFNLFVFAGGVFAGTLSPTLMAPARDGVVGPVRITGADALNAEFARYLASDAECCPSSRVRVSYRIDRAGGRRLVPTEARPIR